MGELRKKVAAQAAALKSQQSAQASSAGDYNFAAALNSVLPSANGADLQALANAQRLALQLQHQQQLQQQNGLQQQMQQQMQAAAMSSLLSQGGPAGLPLAHQLPQHAGGLPGAVSQFQNPLQQLLASQMSTNAMLNAQGINPYGSVAQQQMNYIAQQQQSPAVARLLQQLTAQARPPAIINPPMVQQIPPNVTQNPVFAPQAMPPQVLQSSADGALPDVQHNPVSPP